MRKNVLAMSIAALVGGLGLAGGASASVLGQTTRTADTLQVNRDGVGHILLVPYYSAQGDNSTVVTLVNTDTSNGKVLKVRFRGAANSDDVLDFTLFMSPGDVWSGGISNVDGRAAMKTADNSCVLPQGINNNTPVPFVTSRLGAAGAAGTLEGYVEVLTMADVPFRNTTGSLYNAIKHVNGVAPCFTGAYASLLSATTAPSLALNPQNDGEIAALGLANPTTGLFGNWTIVNVAEVSSWGGAATSIEARAGIDGPAAAGNVVFYPQVNAPVPQVELDNTADPLLDFNPGSTGGFVIARMYDFPDLSTPYVTDGTLPTAPTSNTRVAALLQADELTRALAVTSVKNEYITAADVSGDTDWVFSMPTRRYHVALNYVTQQAVFNGLFTSRFFSPSNIFVDSSAARKQLAGESTICVRLESGTLAYFDRSEQQPDPDLPPFVISPSDPIVVPALTFCGEASVLAFNSASSEVLGASIGLNTIDLNDGFEAGWAAINTTSNVFGYGLPILGSAYQKLLSEPSATSPAGNFGSVWPHRFTRATIPQLTTLP